MEELQIGEQGNKATTSSLECALHPLVAHDWKVNAQHSHHMY